MKDYTLGSVIRAGAWGVLLGGFGGLLLGLLLAPEEGRRLRRRLSYRLENVGTQAGGLVDRVLGPEPESEARRTGDAVVADARARAQRIRDDIDSLLGEMRRHEGPRPPSAPAE